MLQGALPKAELFFKQHVLPELLARSMDHSQQHLLSARTVTDQTLAK